MPKPVIAAIAGYALGGGCELTLVADIRIAAIPDPYRGETVKAYIVLQPDTEATEEEFISFCRTKLAPFKIPRQVEFRDVLPRTIVGKVLRRQLIEEEKAKIQDKNAGNKRASVLK